MEIYLARRFSRARATSGNIFEVAAGSHTLSNIVSFFSTNTPGPYGGLIADAAGNLYGTSSGTSSHPGLIFELTNVTHQLITLAQFDGTDGSGPLGNLIFDSSGNLFGTTSGGGADNDGTVFELPAGSHTPVVLASVHRGPTGQIHIPA